MTKTTAITPVQPFAVEMPDDAPALGFDPQAESFSWHDVLPANYWNLDLLEAKAAILGGNPVLTPARIVIKPVVDPEEKDPDLTPKIVLEFAEGGPALVFNKTRCVLATKLTGTPNPRAWADALPPLELYAGAYREMASAMQILFRPVAAAANGRGSSNGRGHESTDAEIEAAMGTPPAYTMDNANDDLFGF